MFNSQMMKHFLIIRPTELLANLSVPEVEPPLKLHTHKAVENNAQFFQELMHIVQRTEAKVYVDEFIVHLEFRAAWRKLYNTFLGSGAKDMLAVQLKKTIHNLWYNGQKGGFTFNTYVEWHKTAYQSMLDLVKKTNYTTYDSSTRVCHFLNSIMDPALAQAKLSLEANHEQYSGNFDAVVEYLMNPFSHHHVNQQHSIASVGSGAPGHLKGCNDCGRELEMQAIKYSLEKQAQLLLAQTTSIWKRRADAKWDFCCGLGGYRGCGNHKRQ